MFSVGTHVNHAAACEHDDDVNDADDEDDVNQGEDKDDFNYANCDEHNGENDNLKEVGDNHGQFEDDDDVNLENDEDDDDCTSARTNEG